MLVWSGLAANPQPLIRCCCRDWRERERESEREKERKRENERKSTQELLCCEMKSKQLHFFMGILEININNRTE